MKKVIRLTENDLHKIVKNSVKKVLMENKNEEAESDVYIIRKAADALVNANSSIVYTNNRELNDVLCSASKLVEQALDLLNKYTLKRFDTTLRDLDINDYKSTDSQFENEREYEDWYERNAHGDFDSEY